MTVSVPIPGPLVEARFRARPNRFVVVAELASGSEAIAHLADPGRLVELLVPGRRIWLRPAVPGSPRVTNWSAVLVETPDGSGLASLNTMLPNRLIARAMEQGALPELGAYELERAEFPLGRSRFDFLLRSRGPRRSPSHLVLEVKSVTLVKERVALFPDAVTARGARHVAELTKLVRGRRFKAAVLFVVQRNDAQRVSADASIDPHFAMVLEQGQSAGVQVLARRCRVELDQISLGEPLPVE